MLNTIINRINILQFDGRNSLERLDVLSNVAVTFLKDRLKSYCVRGEAEMIECMTEINAVLEKDYSGRWGNDKFTDIKTDVLRSLEKLSPFYHDDPNNKPNSVNFIDDEKKLTMENERDLDFLIVEQNNIDYFKGLPARTQNENHGRLKEHYIGLGGINGEYLILKESDLPVYIKNEFDAVFKKWQKNEDDT